MLRSLERRRQKRKQKENSGSDKESRYLKGLDYIGKAHSLASESVVKTKTNSFETTLRYGNKVGIGPSNIVLLLRVCSGAVRVNMRNFRVPLCLSSKS